MNSSSKPTSTHDKWYFGHPMVWVLAPLSLLFYFVTALRRVLYKIGLKSAYKAKVPVIVVGNISVGGNGKTPVVLALAKHYASKGLKVGILSRGYGGKSDVYPRQVDYADSASEVGDEPRLLAKRSGCVVVIDPKRARGAEYLASDLQCDIIICDDGLQHYRLHRDVELIVMDDRKVGSGYLLPMGPLREGQWRLAHVDAVIHNARSMPTFDNAIAPQFLMTLVSDKFVNVADPTLTKKASDFVGESCSAIAGIGSPVRFFNQLETLGIALSYTYPMPDHHAYVPSDLPKGTVIMTEKDAVKVQDFAHKDCWYLPVDAHMAADFYTLIDTKLSQAGLAAVK